MTEQWIDDEDHCQHSVRDSEYDDWDTADDYCCHCECCCTCLGCEYGPRDGMLMTAPAKSEYL